jgi:hypothetical protein
MILIHQTGCCQLACFLFYMWLMKVFEYPNRLPEIYGTVIFLGLLVLLFLLRFTGLIHVIELRLVNIAIFVAAIHYAIQQHKRTHGNKVNYFRALSIGIGASFIGISIFASFMFVYLKLNRNFLEILKEDEMMGYDLDAYVASFSVWVHGIFSGLFSTFLVAHGTKTTP